MLDDLLAPVGELPEYLGFVPACGDGYVEVELLEEPV